MLRPSIKLNQRLSDTYMRTGKGTLTLFLTCGRLPCPEYPTLSVGNLPPVGLGPSKLLSVLVLGMHSLPSIGRCSLNRLPAYLSAHLSLWTLPSPVILVTKFCSLVKKPHSSVLMFGPPMLTFFFFFSLSNSLVLSLLLLPYYVRPAGMNLFMYLN